MRRRFDLPGMAVLHFGFGGEATNPHHPSAIQSDQVVYTGTHDNDTTLGWWEHSIENEGEGLELLNDEESPHEGLIRMALESRGPMA